MFAIIATSFLLQQLAHAQTRTTSLTASPAIIDTGGEAGAEVAFSFQLTNNGETILPIRMTSRDSRTRTGQAEETMSSLSAKSWVVYSEPDFILQEKETKQVNATLKIPEDAGPGGHYADLVVQSLSLEGDDSIITTKPEIAVQMLVSVAGEIKEDLSANLEGPTTMLLTPSSDNSLSFSVKNNGNIHSLFTPRLALKHRRQELVVVASQPEIVLPGEEKQIKFDLPENLRSGLYNTQLSFTYGAPLKEVTSPQMHLIVMPFSPKLLLFIPLLAAAFYAYRARRRIISAIRVITRGENTSSKK